MNGWSRWLVVALVAGLALAVSVGVVGCARPGTDATPTYGEGTSTGDSTSVTPAPAIGLRELDSGRVEAVGFLVYVDLEGGFWALAETLPGDGKTATPELVAVISNPDAAELPSTPAGSARFDVGDLVRVEGTLFEGATVRMAGPEVVVESIEVVTETVAP